MKTERFISRHKKLEKVFTVDTLVRVWRNIVKEQLRHQDIEDLYDFYDFNYLIIERAKDIRNDVLDGTYSAQVPLFFNSEKNWVFAD